MSKAVYTNKVVYWISVILVGLAIISNGYRAIESSEYVLLAPVAMFSGILYLILAKKYLAKIILQVILVFALISIAFQLYLNAGDVYANHRDTFWFRFLPIVLILLGMLCYLIALTKTVKKEKTVSDQG